MSDFHPDKVGYYGKPLSSLSKDELLKAASKMHEIIHNVMQKADAMKFWNL